MRKYLRMSAAALALVMALALLPATALAAPPAITWLPNGVEPSCYIEETGQFIGTDGTDVVLISPTGTVTKLENPGYDASPFYPFYFSEGMASVSHGHAACGYIHHWKTRHSYNLQLGR